MVKCKSAFVRIVTRLIDITGKALSGEWGTDDLDGCGMPVLRTTNFTNIGKVNYDNVVTRNIQKKNISEKLLKNQVELIKIQLVELFILKGKRISTYLIILLDYYELKTRMNGIQNMFFTLCLQIITEAVQDDLKIRQLDCII